MPLLWIYQVRGHGISFKLRFFFLTCIVEGDEGDVRGVFRGNKKGAIEVLICC